MYNSSLNLNLYKIFYDVAQYGSVSTASKNLMISQPAISRSIKKLEEDLNVTLFYRTLNGMVLTEKGKELLNYVEDACNSLRIGERTMMESNNLIKGKLSIGVPSHIATFYIFDAIDDFHKKHPNIEITLISKSTSKLLELLKSHQIDFMIDSEPIPIQDKSIKKKHITYLHNTFVAGPSFDVNNIKDVKDLHKYPLILPIKGTANRSNLDEFFVKNNCKINNILNIHTSEVIIGAIKRNLGIGYIIKELVSEDIKNGNLKEIKFKDVPKIGISLVYIEDYITASPRKFLKDYYNINI